MIPLLIFNKAAAQAAAGKDSSIYLADPAIFYYHDHYFLYGTLGGNTNDGFKAYTSTDLKNWKLPATENEFALSKANAFGEAQFWAPHVFLNGNKITMAYVANEQIAIATSESPGGPFTQQVKKSLDAPVKQIDPFLFIDEDGKKYLYHVRLKEGNRIFVAEMEDDLSAIKPATLTECITAKDSWENTASAPWPVAEGPSVLKHNNVYYLFYTANDFRNPDYAVGYATSSSPYGPWKKFEGNPIISKKNLGVNGPGHGDFFIDGDKKLQYVFHTHFSDTKVGPRRTAMVRVEFVEKPGTSVAELKVDTKSFHYLFTTSN